MPENAHQLRISRPDRRSHGGEVVSDEFLGIVTRRHIVTKSGIVSMILPQVGSRTVEAQDVTDHAMKRRAQEVASLREERVERSAVVFQAGFCAGNAKAHGAGLRGHTQPRQQLDEVGIGPVVEHDEPGIDGVCPAVQRDRNSMGMSADVIVGLEDSHFMCCAEQVGGEHAGDAGSADRNFHSSCGPEQSA